MKEAEPKKKKKTDERARITMHTYICKCKEREHAANCGQEP